MRKTILGLAACSLLLAGCGDDSTGSTYEPKLSDAELLASLTGYGLTDMVSDFASFTDLAARAGAARTQDECTEAVNYTDTQVDEDTGDTLQVTMTATLLNGSAITCSNYTSMTTSGYKMTITESGTDYASKIAMTFAPSSTGYTIKMSGSMSAVEDSVAIGIKDMSMTMVLDTSDYSYTLDGSFVLSIDGATIGPVAFDENGLTSQTVAIKRDGATIGYLVIDSEGEVVVKDTNGNVVEQTAAARAVKFLARAVKF